jgi:dipeptidase E
MKFLLTSCGMSNDSIRNTLVDLLGKPISESSALVIPTAAYAYYPDGADMAYQLIRGVAASPLCELGWKSLGVLELTALPSITRDHWVPLVQETDALLVGGGDPFYLCYWMRQSGLADLLLELGRETVYVGVSGGSMVVTPISGEQYDGIDSLDPHHWRVSVMLDQADRQTGSDRALGLVDFTLYPHLDHPSMPEASLANLERWAAGVDVPVYLIDDQTAITVIDGAVEVVSEGHWKRFVP